MRPGTILRLPDLVLEYFLAAFLSSGEYAVKKNNGRLLKNM